MSRLIALLLEYDGTAYAGWQRQANGRSIQEKLEQAIRKVTGRRAACIAAGRTDAGTHAAGQVVHFKTASKLPLEKWLGALNAHLPPDIAVQEVREAKPGFHARFSTKGKTYTYTIWNARGRSALLRDRAWHVPVPLSLPAMRQAAKLLVGRHDFRAFAQMEGVKDRKSTVRRVTGIRIRSQGPQVTVSVTGDGFLTHMVRTMVGTLVEVGKGKRRASWVGEVLRGRKRAAAGMTAPASGLTLLQVDYPNLQLPAIPQGLFPRQPGRRAPPRPRSLPRPPLRAAP